MHKVLFGQKLRIWKFLSGAAEVRQQINPQLPGILKSIVLDVAAPSMALPVQIVQAVAVADVLSQKKQRNKLESSR